MYDLREHIVPEMIAPMRLQEYGVGIFDLIPTRSALKKVLKKKWITVNGVLATTATFIYGGETICLSVPEAEATERRLILKLHVLYEDEHLAVIHKPAGIQVSGNKFKTIANALPHNLRPSALSDATRPQPAHRLDFATTGLLMVGKTAGSIRALNQLFEDKAIQKTYYAIAIGLMKKDRGEITTSVDDKDARTDYERIKTLPSERFDQLNLVRLTPLTGRRHQLRKHLSSIGNPILGDKDYGTEGLILNGKGLYLHAFSLAFTHPFTGERIQIEDELPQRFLKIFTPSG